MGTVIGSWQLVNVTYPSLPFHLPTGNPCNSKTPKMTSSNGTHENITITSPSTSSLSLPRQAMAYIPFFLAEFALVVAANVILLVLISKVRQLHTSSLHTYLRCLAFANLLQSVTIATLIVALVSRQWELGGLLCSINSFLLAVPGYALQLTHMAIGRNRYVAMRDPMKCTVNSKRTYVRVVIIWIVAIVAGVFTTILLPLGNNPFHPGHDESVFVCYGASSNVKEEDSERDVATLTVVSLQIASFYTILLFWFIITSTHYALALRNIQKLDYMYNQRQKIENLQTLSTKTSQATWRDEPLECTAEERATKPMAVLFAYQFILILITVTHSSVRDVQSAITATPTHELVSSHEHLAQLLVIFLLPLSPILLLHNRKVRGHLAKLFRCSQRAK